MPLEADALTGPRILFVTGRLAEAAVRRVVAELAAQDMVQPEVAVLPISVAALLTTDWIGTHLGIAAQVDKVMIPGLCRGDVEALEQKFGVPVERGPNDVRELHDHFGAAEQSVSLDKYDIQIIAEINDAPSLPLADILTTAKRLQADGADIIDLGCHPGSCWNEAGPTVRALRDQGIRVSIDSFNAMEIQAATRAGAELVLSVNSSNMEMAKDWGAEVVAIPDEPATLGGLAEIVNHLEKAGVRFRIDPILEPIGFGFAASLNRYAEVRRRYPEAAMMMGVANVTELTDADSCGINVILAAYCQELGVRSVLTTQVAPWCRSCIQELNLARRLVYYAIQNHVAPKKLCRDLIITRDPKLVEQGEMALNELAATVTDPNYRLYAERGQIHVINNAMHLQGSDPFQLWDQMLQADKKISARHAFYLGFEMAKAMTALTLGKQYTQDQALRWGFLTTPDSPPHPE